MSKNLTRKGLALGSASALIATAFGVLPANAAGLADTSFVSLAPTTGTEYTVLSGTGMTFSLSANEASTVVSGNVKYLVTDASGVVEPTASTTARTLITVDVSADTISLDLSELEVVLVDTSGNFSGIEAGDLISFASALGADVDSTNGFEADEFFIAADTPVEVTDVTGAKLTFTTPEVGAGVAADYGTPGTDNGAIDTAADFAISVVREKRNTTYNTYVVDSGVASASTSEVLELTTTGTDTRSVTVQAWVDANTNDKIDDTEYASPVRTVTFKKASELEFGYTFAPAVGDETLDLVFTTTPVLNGQQVDAQDGSAVFGALFTRQDSSDADNYATDANSTWDDTNKEWTAKVSMDLATQAWTDLTEAPAVSVTVANSSVADEVATITSATHYLRVGDKVTLSGVTDDTDLNDTWSVVEIVSATVFKLAVAGVADNAALTGTVTATPATYTGADAITDRVFPGIHTAQVYVGTTKLGAKQTATVGSSASASSLLEIAGSSTIQPASFDAAADANNIEVKKGVTSVTMTVTVYDAAEKAVGAGRNVAVALGAPNEGAKTGTFTLNGKAVTSTTLQTDANGQVTITIGENDGDVAAQVRVTATPENISGAATSVDLLWNDVTYALYDLNDASTSRQEHRTMNKNGSLSFVFAVLDQWKSAPADGTFRLKVDNAGNTVSSAYHAVVAGRASVTVTDGQIGAGTSIDTDITVEKDVLGVWTAQDSISWNDAGLGDLAINIKDQTDKVVLDVDGSTIYGNATADLSNNIAAKATVAQDRRTEIASQPAYGSNAVVVTGRVVNSVTNAVRPGSVVTLTGPSSVLFSEGGVDSFGSITVIADSSGEFGVDLFSNTAQKDSVITVSSNGVSSTVKVTFAAVGATAGTSLVIDAPASVNPGSTFMVKATLTDKYGNAVSTGTNDQLKVTYTGPGIVFGTLPDDTDVNGQISFAVLLGANDSGSATVVVSYDQSDDGDFTGTTLADADLTVSKSIVVGVAGNTGAFSSWTKKLDDNSAKMYAKNVVGEGKVQFFLNGEEIAWVRAVDATDPKLRTANGSAYLVRTVEFEDGKNVLEIYLDGVRTTRTAYTK